MGVEEELATEPEDAVRQRVLRVDDNEVAAANAFKASSSTHVRSPRQEATEAAILHTQY